MCDPASGEAIDQGDEIEVVEVWGLVQRGEAILHTVHDAVLLASQTQQRMLNVLEGHADLRRLVKRKWQGTGQQMIEMRAVDRESAPTLRKKTVEARPGSRAY